ncbi:hypothetical protein L0Y69_00905 [bacterium]|nr:hypothetical protein [bacterium]
MSNIQNIRKYKKMGAALPKQELPKSWKKAAGLLKGRGMNGVAYQRKVRQEWEARMKKLEQMAKKK